MDAIVQSLIQARDHRVVLKARLLNLDSKIGNMHIFAFEGRDDREAYSIWLRRTKPDLSYEPFECGSKKKVLSLFDLVEADKGDLQERVLFFVDRDFDELQGRTANPRIFMTQRYSVESYLVDRLTLDDILRVELHCHENPEARASVLDLFENSYSQFLAVTEELNWRIFIARKANIIFNSITDRLSDFAEVSLEKVQLGRRAAYEIIRFEVEPEQMLLEALRRDFDALERAHRYRGKFSLMFFKRWLEILSEERRTAPNRYFPDRTEHRIRNEFTVLALASRSPIPEGLLGFIENVSNN